MARKRTLRRGFTTNFTAPNRPPRKKSAASFASSSPFSNKGSRASLERPSRREAKFQIVEHKMNYGRGHERNLQASSAHSHYLDGRVGFCDPGARCRFKLHAAFA